MPQLTRRLASDAGQPQQWLIWFDGVNVGQIRERHGAPFGSDAWEWFCGFYPGSQPGEQRMGAAATFEAARDALREIAPRLKRSVATAEVRARVLGIGMASATAQTPSAKLPSRCAMPVTSLQGFQSASTTNGSGKSPLAT